MAQTTKSRVAQAKKKTVFVWTTIRSCVGGWRY